MSNQEIQKAVNRAISNYPAKSPLRLLAQMHLWASISIFNHIWGEGLGQHFYRKFIIERKGDVQKFVPELDEKNEKALFNFLTEQCNIQENANQGQTKKPQKTFMVFYRRNHAGIETMFHSNSLISITHEFICNIKARNVFEAMLKMNPDSWDTSHDARTNNSTHQIHNHPEISIGDVLIEYTKRGATDLYVIVKDKSSIDGQRPQLMPPWKTQK